MFVDSLFSEGFQLVESKRTLKTGSWQSEPHLEKQGVGDQVPTEPMSRFCPGQLGALEVERRIGVKAGAWVGKSSGRRFGFLSLVADACGGAGCVLLEREGRVSCSIGGVGWCLKRVRGSETARWVSNSQRFGWRSSLVAGLAVSFVVSVGCDAVACRSELVSGAASLGCGVSCFVPGLVVVAGRVGRWGPALTPRSS
jgi:hypothetical protein